MALTREQAVYKAMFRVRKSIGQDANALSYEDIDSYHDEALRKLIDDIVIEAEQGQDWVIPHKLTSNVMPVSANIFPIPDAICIESIASQGQVTANGGSGSGNPLQFKPNLEDVQFGGLCEIWEYYTIGRGSAVGGAILTFKHDGTNFLPTSINISAAVYPVKPATATGTFTDLPVQLEETYIDKLVELVKEKWDMASGKMPPPFQSTQPA